MTEPASECLKRMKPRNGALASSSRPLSKVQVVNPVQRGARCLDGR
jgi:hypothetical protein